MDRSELKMIGLDYGDPFDIRTFSGSSYYIWTTLQKMSVLEDAFTPYPSKTMTTFFKLISFRPSIQQWRASWRRSIYFKRYISRQASDIINSKYRNNCNVMLQIGAYYNIGNSFDGIKGLLADNNCAITQRTNINFQSSDTIFQRQFAFEKEVYNSMDRVFCFSHFLAGSMVSDFGCDPKKVVVVGAGINADESQICFERDYNSKTILFSGFDFVNKGGKILFAAFELVRKQIPEAKLILLGPSLPSVPEGVTNHGYLSKAVPEQMALISDSYKKASIFVLPTFADAFPNVVREAMAAKLPVIASNIGSIPEMIEQGKTGYLIPAHEIEPLAERMIELLSDPGRCSEMATAGYEVYQSRFTWTAVCNKIVDELKQLL